MLFSARLDWQERLESREGLTFLPLLPFPPLLPSLDRRGLSHDALQRPTLAAAERSRFDDLDGIPGFRHAVFIVHHERGRSALGFAVHAVPNLPLDRDDNALLHLVADDDADLFGLLSHC